MGLGNQTRKSPRLGQERSGRAGRDRWGPKSGSRTRVEAAQRQNGIQSFMEALCKAKDMSSRRKGLRFGQKGGQTLQEKDTRVQQKRAGRQWANARGTRQKTNPGKTNHIAGHSAHMGSCKHTHQANSSPPLKTFTLGLHMWDPPWGMGDKTGPSPSSGVPPSRTEGPENQPQLGLHSKRGPALPWEA